MAAQPIVAGKAKKAAKADAKKAAKEAKKTSNKSPVVSKQAKDAARKKAAAAMRDVVSRQGKAYDRIVKEMDRDEFREYILSVRHKSPEPVQQLCDWLPIAEVVVADKQAYEVRPIALTHSSLFSAQLFMRVQVTPAITHPRLLTIHSTRLTRRLRSSSSPSAATSPRLSS